MIISDYNRPILGLSADSGLYAAMQIHLLSRRGRHPGEMIDIQEGPHCRVGAGYEALESVVLPFCQVGRSRKSTHCCIPLVPSELVKDRLIG